MGKSIIITGAGRGIGKETAETFLNSGWRVGLVGRNRDALEETAAGNARAMVLPADVTDENAITHAFDRVADAWGRLDTLFNNAGVSLPSATVDGIDAAQWRNLMDINVTGSFLCAKAAFRIMRNQEPQGGRIINNGSVSAHVPRWGASAYTASKHAITGLTRSISLDGRPFSIACGQIDIGNALTDMARKMTTGMPQADGGIRVEPVMDAGNVANSVLHMASMPLDANVQFMTVMATNMPYIGRG